MKIIIFISGRGEGRKRGVETRNKHNMIISLQSFLNIIENKHWVIKLIVYKTFVFYWDSCKNKSINYQR